MHDRFASYLSRLSDETDHGLCNAHLLRNLEEIVKWEQAPDGWAARLQRGQMVNEDAPGPGSSGLGHATMYSMRAAACPVR